MVPVFNVDIESDVPRRAQTTLAKIISEHPEGLDVTDVAVYYKDKNGYDIEPDIWGFRSLSDVVSSLQNIFRSVQCKNGNMRLFAAFLPAGEEEVRLLADPFDATPEYVKNRLRKLVNADGIYQDELLGAYQTKYGERLKYDAYGYETLDTFVKAQTGGIFSSAVHEGRVVLTGISHIDNNEKLVTIYTIETLAQMDRKLFPPDCISPSDHLKNISKKELTPFKEIQIRIYDPVNFTYFTGFHFNLMDYAKQYEQHVNDMTAFYEENKEKYKLPEWAAVVQIYCVACWEEKWFRLQILETHGIEVLCLLLDYGMFHRFSKKDLYFLHYDFAKLPCQIFEGKLAFCTPPEKINREAEEYFERKTQGVLHATVVRVDDSGYVELLLYVNDVDFLSVLVKKNYAKRGVSATKKEPLSDDDEIMAAMSISTGGPSEIDAFEQSRVENSSNPNECSQPIASETDIPVDGIKSEKDNDGCAETIVPDEQNVPKCSLKTEEEEEADTFLRSSTPLLPSPSNENSQLPSLLPTGPKCDRNGYQEEPGLKQSGVNNSFSSTSSVPPGFTPIVHNAAPVSEQSNWNNTSFNSSMLAPGFNPVVRNAAHVLEQSHQNSRVYNSSMEPPGFSPAVHSPAPGLNQSHSSFYNSSMAPPGFGPVFRNASPGLDQSHLNNTFYDSSMPPPGFAPVFRNAAPVLEQSLRNDSFYNYAMLPRAFFPVVRNPAPSFEQSHRNSFYTGVPCCRPGFVSPMCMMEHLLNWADRHRNMTYNRENHTNFFSMPECQTNQIPRFEHVRQPFDRTTSTAPETALYEPCLAESRRGSQYLVADSRVVQNEPELKNDALYENSGTAPKTEPGEVEDKHHVGSLFSVTKDTREEDHRDQVVYGERDIRFEKVLIDGEKLTFIKILVDGRPYLSVAELCNKIPLMPSEDDLLYDSLILITEDEEPHLWEVLEPVVSRYSDIDDEIFLIPFEMLLRFIMSSTFVPELVVIKLFNVMQQHCRSEDTCEEVKFSPFN